MAHVLVILVAVLVHVLAAGALDVLVAVAVWVDEIIRPEQASQGTVDGRVLQDLAEVGDSGQDVVAGVAGGDVEVFDLAADTPVERVFMVGVDREIAVDEVGLYLGVGEENGCGHIGR